MLNMCSAAASSSGSSDDAPGREAIIHAAVDLVGRGGPDGTTVRAVAERADVSAALVIHHFGSKAGLIEACDAHVRVTISAAADAITEDPRGGGVQALLGHTDLGPALAYVARSLQSGGEVGRWWFAELLEVTDRMLPALVESGVARRPDDPEMTALLLMAMEVGLLLMRPLVEERLGGDLTDEAVLARWARAELDLLSHALLIDREDVR